MKLNGYAGLYLNNGKVPKGELRALEMERKRLLDCISFSSISSDQHYALIRAMKANNCSNYFKIRYTKIYSEILKSDIEYLKIMLSLGKAAVNTYWKM